MYKYIVHWRTLFLYILRLTHLHLPLILFLLLLLIALIQLSTRSCQLWLSPQPRQHSQDSQNTAIGICPLEAYRLQGTRQISRQELRPRLSAIQPHIQATPRPRRSTAEQKHSRTSAHTGIICLQNRPCRDGQDSGRRGISWCHREANAVTPKLSVPKQREYIQSLLNSTLSWTFGFMFV